MTFQKVITENFEINKVQTNINKKFEEVTSNRILQGRLIENVSLAAGTDKTIDHGLGRSAKWLVVRNSAEGYPQDKQSTNPTPSQTLVLFSTSARTVDLYVF